MIIDQIHKLVCERPIIMDGGPFLESNARKNPIFAIITSIMMRGLGSICQKMCKIVAENYIIRLILS